MIKDIKIGFIGAGNMASCLVGGLINHGYPKNQIFMADHRQENCQRFYDQWQVSTSTDPFEIIPKIDVLVLAIKPQSLRGLVEKIAAGLHKNNLLVISVAAGITSEQIRRWADNLSLPLIRALPNTPSRFQVGVTDLYATKEVTAKQRDVAEKLFSAVGESFWISDESLMNVVSALSGSGPAYFFYIMECLIDAAIELGVSPELARKLTLLTAYGSSTMALKSTDSVTTLREQVTSKGGITEQGIKVFEDAELKKLFARAITAASKHGQTLSENYG